MRLCSIASGSSGNCIYVGSDKTHLLVDAGISGKKVEFGLNSLDLTTGDLDGILVTHEHSDHIKGLGVVARKCGVPIYATQGTIRAMENSGSLGKMPEGIFHEVTPDLPDRRSYDSSFSNLSRCCRTGCLSNRTGRQRSGNCHGYGCL